jgi:hypothetical protein
MTSLGVKKRVFEGHNPCFSTTLWVISLKDDKKEGQKHVILGIKTPFLTTSPRTIGAKTPVDPKLPHALAWTLKNA